MIVWINGTFGVGKTTTASALADLTGWRTFDPEHVGYLLAGNLRDLDFDDFQDLPPWRSLVPSVAAEIFRFTKPDALICVQTVLVEQYWEELAAGFRRQDLPVFHVVLDCEIAELRRRIETDEVEHQALDWRMDHIERFENSRPWLIEAADLVVDTTGMTAREAAGSIGDAAAAVERKR